MPKLKYFDTYGHMILLHFCYKIPVNSWFNMPPSIEKSLFYLSMDFNVGNNITSLIAGWFVSSITSLSIP